MSVRTIGLVAGFGICSVLAGGFLLSHQAWAQNTSPRLPGQDTPMLVCYQNGQQIFQIGPLTSVTQAGGESYLDYRQKDGSRGQVRIVGTAVCLVTTNPPAPMAKNQ